MAYRGTGRSGIAPEHRRQRLADVLDLDDIDGLRGILGGLRAAPGLAADTVQARRGGRDDRAA